MPDHPPTPGPIGALEAARNLCKHDARCEEGRLRHWVCICGASAALKTIDAALAHCRTLGLTDAVLGAVPGMLGFVREEAESPCLKFAGPDNRCPSIYPGPTREWCRPCRARALLSRLRAPSAAGDDGPTDPEVVRDLLLLVEDDCPNGMPSLDEIIAWPVEAREQVADWAGALYTRASDNYGVVVPKVPAILLMQRGTRLQRKGHEL